MIPSLRNVHQVALSLLSLLALLIIPSIALADSSDQSSQEIYYGILSPFCPGRSLADCPSEQASALKDKIKSELVAGKNKEVILDEIIKEYGEQFRAAPKMSGWNSLAWLIPILIVFVGFVIVIFKIRSKEVDGIADD